MCSRMCPNECVLVSLCVAHILNSFTYILMYAECCPVKIKNEISKRWSTELHCFSLERLLRPFSDWLRYEIEEGRRYLKRFTLLPLHLRHWRHSYAHEDQKADQIVVANYSYAPLQAVEWRIMTMIQWFHKLQIRLIVEETV